MTAHGDVQVRALCAGSSECQSGVCAALCVQVGVHIRRGVEWQVGWGPGLGAAVCTCVLGSWLLLPGCFLRQPGQQDGCDNRGWLNLHGIEF